MANISNLSKERVQDILPLLYKIYPSINPDDIKERLDLVARSDWQCEIIEQEGAIIALSGYRIMHRFCYGKFMYIDHFVVDDAYRGSSTTMSLLDHLVALAERKGCESIILDTFITNSKAQKLWLNNKFQIVGFHFQRQLGA